MRRWERIGGETRSQSVLREKSKNKPSPRYALLAVVVGALILSAVTFIIIINKRTNDQAARDQIRAEAAGLEEVVVNMQLAETLAIRIVADKALALGLLPGYEAVKDAIANTTQQIEQIDVNTELFNNMTQLVQTLSMEYAAQLEALDLAFQQLQSEAELNATVIKSGTCTLQGITNAPITYDYKLATIEGLDYYYYVLGTTPYDVVIDNTGFRVESCDNGGIYQGTNDGQISPLFQAQLSKFGGDAAAEIRNVAAGTGKLEFQTTGFAGTRNLAIATPLSNFVEFF